MQKSGGKNPSNDDSEEFTFFIKAFVIGMPTNCIIIEYFVNFILLSYFPYFAKWLFDTIKDNSFEYNINVYFMFFCYVMILISYYKCMNIKNTVPFRVNHLILN